MNSKTHIIGGLGAGVIALPIASSILGVENPVNLLSLAGGVSIVSGVIGGLFPDIDHKNSCIGKKLKPISAIISSTCGHRGLTHAPLIYMVLLAFSLFKLSDINFYWLSALIGFFAGVYSHILLDTFTVRGIPWLYPFTKKKFSLGLFATGGTSEKVFRFVLTIFVFLLSAKLI